MIVEVHALLFLQVPKYYLDTARYQSWHHVCRRVWHAHLHQYTLCVQRQVASGGMCTYAHARIVTSYTDGNVPFNWYTVVLELQALGLTLRIQMPRLHLRRSARHTYLYTRSTSVDSHDTASQHDRVSFDLIRIRKKVAAKEAEEAAKEAEEEESNALLTFCTSET